MEKNTTETENHNNTYERNPRNIRWIRADQVNYDKFRPMLEQIIGGNRSMSEFARECDVSISSISRLLNGQAKEPTSQMLFALLEHADPESGVTVDMLFEAAGLRPQTSIADIRAERLATERRIKMILITTLVEQGHSVKEIVIEKMPNRAPYVQPDIVLETDAFDGLWELKVFDYDTRYRSYGSSYTMNEEMNIRRSAFMVRRDFIQLLGRIYLESSQNSTIKYTVVLKNKAVYERLVDEFSESIVYDNISFMLVDIEESVIVSEYTLNKATAKTLGDDTKRKRG